MKILAIFRLAIILTAFTIPSSPTAYACNPTMIASLTRFLEWNIKEIGLFFVSEPRFSVPKNFIKFHEIFLQLKKEASEANPLIDMETHVALLDKALKITDATAAAVRKFKPGDTDPFPEFDQKAGRLIEEITISLSPMFNRRETFNAVDRELALIEYALKAGVLTNETRPPLNLGGEEIYSEKGKGNRASITFELLGMVHKYKFRVVSIEGPEFHNTTVVTGFTQLIERAKIEPDLETRHRALNLIRIGLQEARKVSQGLIDATRYKTVEISDLEGKVLKNEDFSKVRPVVNLEAMLNSYPALNRCLQDARDLLR